MGSSSGGESTIRYASYVEAKHTNFLVTGLFYRDELLDRSATALSWEAWLGDGADKNYGREEVKLLLANSADKIVLEQDYQTYLDEFPNETNQRAPYLKYQNINFDDAFYGSGYVMSSFPSLYDMFGKFMAGLDIEVLWDQVLDEVQNNNTIQASVIAHRTMLDEDLEQNTLPRMKEGYRDINAVMSSSFVNAKGLMERGVTNKLAEFDANLRYKLLPVAAEVFSKHLAWNTGMINSYMEIMRFAIASEKEADATNYDFALKNAMWPFTILEQERANLGALQGATTSKSGESSMAGGIAGGAMGGAAMGSAILPGWGTAIGGVLGGIAGIF